MLDLNLPTNDILVFGETTISFIDKNKIRDQIAFYSGTQLSGKS